MCRRRPWKEAKSFLAYALALQLRLFDCGASRLDRTRRVGSIILSPGLDIGLAPYCVHSTGYTASVGTPLRVESAAILPAARLSAPLMICTYGGCTRV